MGRYVDIVQDALKILIRVPRSCPRPLFECLLFDSCLLIELMN